MEFLKTHLDGLLVIEPRVFEDSRGFFFESFSQKRFDEYVPNTVFVQDNHSKSNKGILRGLHYQIQHAQGKLVRVVQGSVFDVAVDIRKSSPTFGQWLGIELSGANKKQFWIPPGFAHGFLALEDNTEVLYKTTEFYHPDFERSILWNDKEIGISWPSFSEVILSSKDQEGSPIKNAEVYL
jgi:dTDP-4-dehydrorhamnose 3,5-epimerase